MFAALFEVNPKSDQWDAYLDTAKMLRPLLEQIDGFVENVRYRSLTREGWLLSLSAWEGQKALVRWRTQPQHHLAQGIGRNQVFLDYHLRVGQIIHDTQLPAGQVLAEQRLDETEVGAGTTDTVIDARRPPEWVKSSSPTEIAAWLGLDPDAPGLVGWDVYDAVLSPGDVILVMTWRDQNAAERYAESGKLPDSVRFRQVRIIRDYGKYDRRESPQYYPDLERP